MRYSAYILLTFQSQCNITFVQWHFPLIWGVKVLHLWIVSLLLSAFWLCSKLQVINVIRIMKHWYLLTQWMIVFWTLHLILYFELCNYHKSTKLHWSKLNLLSFPIPLNFLNPHIKCLQFGASLLVITLNTSVIHSIVLLD